MEEIRNESTPLSAPYNFARCFNAQCPKAENCLRHKAALYDISNYSLITVINPICLQTTADGCKHFRSTEKIHVAWGLKTLLDKVPYKAAISIRSQLVAHFGKSAYYRYYRGERFLSSDEQAYIRRLFQQKGVTQEPIYDHYTDEYNW